MSKLPTDDPFKKNASSSSSNINTKGDAKVKTTDALGEMKIVLTRLFGSINHLKTFVDESFYKSMKKKVLTKQIQLIEYSAQFLEEKVDYITQQQGISTICKRTESRKTAAINLRAKVENKMNTKKKRATVNYLSNDDAVLQLIVKDTKRHAIVSDNASSPKRRKVSADDEIKDIVPKNGKVFTIKEAIEIIYSKNISPLRFFQLTTFEQYNKHHPRLLCSRSTLYRHVGVFKEQNIYPDEKDFGLTVGAPQIVQNSELKMLSNDLSNTIGYAEGNTELATNMGLLKENKLSIRGDHTPVRIPNPETTRFYQGLSHIDNPDIHLVKEATAKCKDNRRQMASTSIRNLASHIAAVSYANFRPITEKWVYPKHLPVGCRKLLNLLNQVTGSFFKPINPSYLLNEDCSSQYYFSGTSTSDPHSNGWSRVTTESIVNRNKDSIWKNDPDGDKTCKGIRVKFACGGSAGGFIYPICIAVSGLSTTELPGDQWVVVPIKGLSINGHIDPRNQELGYLCLIGTNVPQKHFFAWFMENITYPTVVNIRKGFNPLSSVEELTENVSSQEEVCMWGDSDIPYLQQMTSPDRIATSIKRGIFFAKIGAKITETSQPLDLGPFFKVLKKSGRHMTSVGMSSPLTILVDIIFKKMRREKVLVLAPLKENALKDCVSTAPIMFSSAFNKDSLTKSFVDSGMLDDKTKSCPDLNGLIRSFKIDWTTVDGGQNWLIHRLPSVISEMYANGEIPESFYDDNDYPLDKDHDGNIWRLTSNADHLTRSSVLYHPLVVQKKSDDIRICVNTRHQHDIRLITESNLTIEMNKDAVLKLKEMINQVKDISSMDDSALLHEATLEMFEKIKAPLLSAFYKCRVLHDLKVKIPIPAKGNCKKINDGVLDKKTKGPFLIKLCHDIRNLHTIYETPEMPEKVTADMDIIPPYVVHFSTGQINTNTDDINNDWIQKVTSTLVNIDGRLRVERCNESLVTYSKELSVKLLSRIHLFLKTRLPVSKEELFQVDIGYGIL